MGDKKVIEPIKGQKLDKINAYNRLNELQLLIKKESYLTELCKKII